MNEGETEIAEEKDWKELEPNYPIKVFLTVLYSLILLTGIVGNGITIRVTQVLRQNGYLQKYVTDHMVSLACSDLLVLLIGMPVELYSATWFPFTSASGDASCKIYNFLFEACSYATILNVATLSFERYIAICHPFRFKALGRERTTGSLIALAWVTSVFVALPLLFVTGMEGHVPERAIMPVQNLTFCTNLRNQWGMYRASIFVAFIVYMVVLVSVGVMCRAMILVLQKTMGPIGRGVNGVEDKPKHESARVKAAKKQTILFLGLIVGSLTVCWLPNQVRRLMTAAVPKSSWTMSYFRNYVVLHPVADTFFYLSSVLNPFLYNLSSRQFRQVFVQVLRCRLTIEHVNKRTLRNFEANSARSLRPLLKSLRRGGGNRSTQTQSKEFKMPTFTTFHSPKDTHPPSPEEALPTTDESLSISVRKGNNPEETEI
ncbi:G-protein coupled receptor 39 [Salmo trutta]|uniref:G protein-coupled receptor 39 n=1 Tax=Salmo trutta TaxID=8032 RepID=A0A673YPT4_SALTR|nr:G-protein coupled receptor 39-like [Salmo trutta]XP_029566713.1 G-protein coupled receptor 39-like [Salmo trutta]